MTKLRIRYFDHKYKANHKISGREFVSNRGAKYRVVLNLEDMEYYIRNERTKEYVFKSKVKYTNLNALKMAAREKLKYFGVDLGKEVRDRSFGLCEKNWSQDKQEQLERERRLKSAKEKEE